MEQLFKQLEVWFVIGSQHLYGDKILQQVAENAELVVKGLNAEGNFPIKLVLKPTVTTPDQISVSTTASIWIQVWAAIT